MAAFDPCDAMVPIFLETDVPKQLVQVGTGVFVELHGDPFLYTVAHVTDDRSRGELLVPTAAGFSRIHGYLAHIDLFPEQSRGDDDIDIAYFRLSYEFASQLCAEFQPLPQDRCELIPNALELGACSATGYPASKARRSVEGTRSSEIFSFRGVGATEEEYEQLGLSPTSNIVLHFSKKRAVDPETGKPFPTPSLRGVSGGGIFAWPHGSEVSSDWSLPKLVGLMHTYREKPGLIIGTTLLPVLAAVQLGRMKGFGGLSTRSGAR